MVSIGPIAAAASSVAQAGAAPGVGAQAPVERARFYAPSGAAKADGTQGAKPSPPGGLLPPASSAGPPSPNTPRGSLLDISV